MKLRRSRSGVWPGWLLCPNSKQHNEGEEKPGSDKDLHVQSSDIKAMFSFPCCSSNLSLPLCLALDKPEILAGLPAQALFAAGREITYLAERETPGFNFSTAPSSGFPAPSSLLSSLCCLISVNALCLASVWGVTRSHFGVSGFFQEPLEFPSGTQRRPSNLMAPQSPSRGDPAQTPQCWTPLGATDPSYRLWLRL